MILHRWGVSRSTILATSIRHLALEQTLDHLLLQGSSFETTDCWDDLASPVDFMLAHIQVQSGQEPETAATAEVQKKSSR